MNKIHLLGSFFLLLGLLGSCAKSVPAKMQPIIPTPISLTEASGEFKITSSTTVQEADFPEFGLVKRFVNEKIKRNTGFELSFIKDEAANIKIRKSADAQLGSEGYKLNVSEKGIQIEAATAKAVFYAFQSIFSLLPPQFEKENAGIDLKIKAVSITDVPQFSYRGMHLDVARHFMPMDFIKKYIDYIAKYKMNTFHWHLTEDQGWRIEIKKYPKLTEIGAWRDETVVGHAAADRGYNGQKHGGFYTQEDIKEIVDYAQSRFVTVIPEIELPGHSRGALAAYPEYGCTGGPYKVATTWGVFDEVYCAGKEGTFKFLQDILDEVIELFPSKYVHIGGDECPKKAWEKCPDCQKRIKKEKLHNEHELQSYFITRIEQYLNSKGKQIIGWDEILEGGLAPNATVMSWRGVEGGITAAKQHHDVIMTPNPVSYLDHYQGDPKTEPLAIGGYTTLEEIYNFNPIPEELNEEEMKYVIGFQANVWTEYIPTPAQAEYMILPRMFAIAETAWRGANKKDFEAFKKASSVELQRLQFWGATTAPITTNENFDELNKRAEIWYGDKEKAAKQALIPHKK